MKTTDTENPNPERAQLHPEQLSTATNPRRLYQVTVRRVDFCETRIRVEAQSEEEAENAAVRLAKRRGEWDEAERDLYAFSVEQVEKGGRHE